ncbi:cupin domain-containing protein [Bacillus pinisoli]|uniref:cupin domain-containing protein n=1 Tax=Bacillus pinisoli TaxID=2901866 RepID=UPI001FF2104B|nr:cupin domain-containing protein [Bacillus pinisoli]
MYQYPYYHQNYFRNVMPEENQQVVEGILDGMKREASVIDLYSRLLTIAPDEQKREDMLKLLEYKSYQLRQFFDLYIQVTGTQPSYTIEQVSFQRYEEGLEKAQELEVEGQEEYQHICTLTQHPQVQQVLLRATKNGLPSEATRAIKDYGREPYVVDIEKVTKKNRNFRTALWTGEHLQVTLMSIKVGEDIGLETHPNLDQFIRIEQGQGLVQMGDRKDNLDYEKKVYDDYAILIPAGKWHNLTNTGKQPLKLYSIYAPPEHPFGTVHKTKADAIAAEENE